MSGNPTINYNACDMKLAVMQYFRAKRNFFAATEVNTGYGIADVLVLDKQGRYYEVEIKINKYDLLNDIICKSAKHACYKNGNSTKFVPNKFYYCIPVELEDVAKHFIDEHNSGYGLIRFSFNRERTWDCVPFLGGHITIAKTAKTIHKETETYLRHAMIMRLTNENIRLREKNFERKYFSQ